MRTIRILIALAAIALFPKNANCSDAQNDEVKRGPMILEVRGLGIVVTHTAVELTIPESCVAEVRRGQVVDVDSRAESILRGRVIRVASVTANGARKVLVRLARATSLVTGTSVDGTIKLGRLNDVIYVGRPVSGSPNSVSTLFKIDIDGAHATKVRVQFGRASVNTIQILAGLQVGDRVILSDMSAWEKQDHIAIK